MSIPGSLTPLFNSGGGAGYQISRSLRFNSSDSAYCSRVPSTAGNRKTWTWAGWVKLSSSTSLSSQDLMSVYVDSSNFTRIILTGDSLYFYNYNSSGNAFLGTTGLLRDYSAWYHFVVVYDADNAVQADRMIIYVNGVRAVTAGTPGQAATGRNSEFNTTNIHNIGRQPGYSVYFNGYLADIHFIDGQALTPSSFTEVSATTGQLIPKAYTGTYGTNGFKLDFADNSAATSAALGKDTSGNGNNWTPNNFIVSNAYTVLPTPSVAPTDPSGAWDGNPSTYAYGPSATTWTFSTPISLPAARFDLHARSGWTWTASTNLGTVTLTSNGTWPGSPGSYPGWYSYANAGLTTVYSISVSAGANWTLQGMQIAGNPSVVGTQLLAFGSQNSSDSLVDTPTSYGTDTAVGGEVRGNYATWNPLTGAITLTNGNLDGNSTGGAWRGATGTTGVLSGKWYWESTIQNTDSGNYYGEFGFIKTTDITGAITFPSGMNGIVYYARNGRKISGGTSVATSSSGATTGDIVQVAVDLDAGKIWFGVNNTWIDSGNPASGANAAYTGLSGTYLPALGVLDGGKCNTNFGQRPFAYTAPSGFKALCDTNLPAPTIAKPSTVMDVALYTGNGTSKSVTGLNFSPEFVWIKSRSAATNNVLFDAVRGAAKILYSDMTSAEVDRGNIIYDFTSFDSNGFTVGISNNAGVNTNNATYAAWCFDAGSNTVSNTQGSITSQVRANASAGFSIVTYTGTGAAATIGHGLNVAPSLILCKSRSLSADWLAYHSSLGGTQYIWLNLTNAAVTDNAAWNNTNPTSTVFSVRTGTGVNSSGATYVAYCFAPVAGYSAFGSYTGNGSTDGPFVYTGFRPRWILIKRTDSSGNNWVLHDTARDTYNAATKQLLPSTADAETDTSVTSRDILSNGFKLRGDNAAVNGSSATYIYAAFAENPFQYSRAR